MKDFGGSGIDKELYDYVRFTVPAQSVVVELGSGHVSTPRFSRVYRLYSVEHDKRFLDTSPGANYIHAPLQKDGWYDPTVLARMLPKRYAALVIDGPVVSSDRMGFCRHIGLFDPAAVWVFHDTNRPADLANYEEAARLSGKRHIEFDEYPFFKVLI